MTNHPLIDLTDRIGGGWPLVEVETCDQCDAPTPTEQDQHLRIIGQTRYWLCDACYRRSLASERAERSQTTLEGFAGHEPLRSVQIGGDLY